MSAEKVIGMTKQGLIMSRANDGTIYIKERDILMSKSGVILKVEMLSYKQKREIKSFFDAHEKDFIAKHKINMFTMLAELKSPAYKQIVTKESEFYSYIFDILSSCGIACNLIGGKGRTINDATKGGIKYKLALLNEYRNFHDPDFIIETTIYTIKQILNSMTPSQQRKFKEKILECFDKCISDKAVDENDNVLNHDCNENQNSSDDQNEKEI